MEFIVKRTRTWKRLNPDYSSRVWQAEIYERVLGGGWEGRPAFGEKHYIWAFTRLGLRLAVRRKCKKLKRTDKTWIVKV